MVTKKSSSKSKVKKVEPVPEIIKSESQKAEQPDKSVKLSRLIQIGKYPFLFAVFLGIISYTLAYSFQGIAQTIWLLSSVISLILYIWIGYTATKNYKAGILNAALAGGLVTLSSGLVLTIFYIIAWAIIYPESQQFLFLGVIANLFFVGISAIFYLIVSGVGGLLGDNL